jgi:hypothetical protein
MPEPYWITHRLPTDRDADSDGEVTIPQSPNDAPGDRMRYQHFSLVVLGQPWYSFKEASDEPTQPEPTPATRKIIQIAVDTSSETYSGCVFALCSDGSLWSRQDLYGKPWERHPDIPGD